MTTNTSICSLVHAACRAAIAEASHSSGWSTSMERASAHFFTDGGVISIPRPCFLLGVETTSEGTRPPASRSSRKTAANSGVPKKANLRPLLFFGFVIIECRRLIRVENTVEMVHFMLEDVCQKARCTARHFRTLFVVRTQHRFLRARYDAPFPAHRKASFVLLLFCARHLKDDGIDVDLVG